MQPLLWPLMSSLLYRAFAYSEKKNKERERGCDRKREYQNEKESKKEKESHRSRERERHQSKCNVNELKNYLWNYWTRPKEAGHLRETLLTYRLNTSSWQWGFYLNVIRMLWDCGKTPILISVYITGIPPHWPSSKIAVRTKRIIGQVSLQEHETFSENTSCRFLKNIHAMNIFRAITRRKRCRHADLCSWGRIFGYYNFNAKQRTFRCWLMCAPSMLAHLQFFLRMRPICWLICEGPRKTCKTMHSQGSSPPRKTLQQLQHTATTATHCSELQQLQRTATPQPWRPAKHGILESIRPILRWQIAPRKGICQGQVLTDTFCKRPFTGWSKGKCVAVCCSVLQCVAVCCSVLQLSGTM